LSKAISGVNAMIEIIVKPPVCRPLILIYAALSLLLLTGGCGAFKKKDSANASGIIVINSPASGEVRRILVSEGSAVSAGTPIIEIAVQEESQTPQPEEDAGIRARNSYRAAQSQVTSAQADAERAAVEVQRVRGLVSGGNAPQSQLDAAQAEYQRAQVRLQAAQSSVQSAQTGIVIQEGKTDSPNPAVVPEKIVRATSTSAGILRVLNAKPGQHVSVGQPIATVSGSND
jgi:multidrug efflux pump subunit AcrA (membrane-fusion protein)